MALRSTARVKTFNDCHTQKYKSELEIFLNQIMEISDLSNISTYDDHVFIAALAKKMAKVLGTSFVSVGRIARIKK